MEFTKLRLSGFKSFADSLELAIESGLTGIVGPNGCGKSNLVEALRWVMGESSYKNMRASSMEEVIFSGSSKRHARLMAEVVLYLDNKDRTAPSAFNNTDELHISRRIEKDVGSLYRVNGQDVRARDVQLLFADASTGARSPSMIGQGRVGELISAKPQSRRALLEEAAGISGLYSRRHEAELRLNSASTNLERVDDMIAQYESRLDGLKRQARQAIRYRNIAGDIRGLEALILHLSWSASCSFVEECSASLSKADVAMGEAQIVQTRAATIQSSIADELPPLREAEAQAAARLQHINITVAQLDEEERRLVVRVQELEDLHSQLLSDKSREENIITTTDEILTNLSTEESSLRSQSDETPDSQQSRKQLEDAANRLSLSEKKLDELTHDLASGRAHQSHSEEVLSEAQSRRERLVSQESECANELSELSRQLSEDNRQLKSDEIARLESEVSTHRIRLQSLEADLDKALSIEHDSLESFNQARASLDRFRTESETLDKILNPKVLFPSIVSDVRLDTGYEQALAAALGEDLDASGDPASPVHWRELPGTDDPSLPDGVESLSSKVFAPASLHRRLAQIGLVDASDGDRLQSSLRVGQRLVSKSGDLWRWDGFKASGASTSAAKRLEQKNRLRELEGICESANSDLSSCREVLDRSRSEVTDLRTQSSDVRKLISGCDEQLEVLRSELLGLERHYGDLSRRHAVLLETQDHLSRSLREVTSRIDSETAAHSDDDSHADLEVKVRELSEQVSRERSDHARAQARFDTLDREVRLKEERLLVISRDRTTWQERLDNARSQIEVLDSRIEKTVTQMSDARQASGGFDDRRQKLLDDMSEAQKLRDSAADRLSSKEQEQKDADKSASESGAILQEARESHIRSQERYDAALSRQVELESRIRSELECEPSEALELAGYKEDDALPDREKSESKLERVKAERERLGAVNLQAEDEYETIAEQRDSLSSERDDLVEAIARLRKAIMNLNKEGRSRLLSAFDTVNGKFQELFIHLFGGGEARLEFVESDDPLEAGLEILACPPGKRLQTMTLLSGGEQALTALALIFAVFLTNPAPICVLDEVDAPLDDHNVERFCNLMENMSNTTNTRFIIITHNPITMSRMDRLFGVTMAERGVSQLVSVDLQTAESYREVG